MPPECRFCGCTEFDPCIAPTTGQPCGWAEPDVCTILRGPSRDPSSGGDLPVKTGPEQSPPGDTVRCPCCGGYASVLYDGECTASHPSRRAGSTTEDFATIRKAFDFVWRGLDANGWLLENPSPRVALDRIEDEVEQLRTLLAWLEPKLARINANMDTLVELRRLTHAVRGGATT